MSLIPRFLFHRQSHIIFEFIHAVTHRPIKMHFLLCSSLFFAEGIDTRIGATQAFVNYPRIPHPFLH